MSPIWQKEWLEFRARPQQLVMRLALPALLLGPLLSSRELSLPALTMALAVMGTYASASQVAKERVSGLLPRLSLSPVPPQSLILHRILARSVLLAVQLGPALAVGAYLGAPADLVRIAPPLILAACAAGVLLGLRTASRRSAHAAGAVAASTLPLLVWGLGRPASVTRDQVAESVALMEAVPDALPFHAGLWLLAAIAVGAAVGATSALWRDQQD